MKLSRYLGDEVERVVFFTDTADAQAPLAQYEQIVTQHPIFNTHPNHKCR